MLIEKNRSKKRLTINAIQNGIFYMLFILLPFAVIPMPWDWTDRGISILILIISTAVVFLEILKFIWDGKFSIFKNSVDTGILLVLLASVVSAIFSVDSQISFWGVDMNLGSGLISLLSVVLVCFVMRSFIDTFDEIVKVLTYLCIGISVINLLSVMSFLEIHFLEFLPAYESVFSYGLPWTISAQTLLVLNGAVFIISAGLIMWNREKKEKISALNIGILVLCIISILLFSINQGFWIVLSLIISMAALIYLTWTNIRMKRTQEKKFRNIMLISLLCLLISFSLLKIPQVKESMLGSSESLTQVSLGGDISWEIVSSGISNKFIRAIVGYGQSTFVMLYNLYKPATTEMLSLNNTNFYYGSNEWITSLAEGGIVWVCAWVILGYFLFKELLSQIKRLKRAPGTEKTVIMLALGMSSVFIYTSSLFCHFGIMLKLIFFVIVSLWVVASNIEKLKIPDKFVLKMSAIDTNAGKLKNIQDNAKNVNIFVTVVLTLGLLTILSVWCRILIADVYISSAEYYISSKNTEFQEEDMTSAEKEEFILKTLDRYSKAEDLLKNDSLTNRKLALLNLEAVSFYADEYSGSEDKNIKEDLLDKVSVYRREAASRIQKAVNRSPELYDNWKTSSSVYIGLLSIGFNDYSNDALDSLGRAIDLNSTNYELYYNAAQVYLIKEETDNALSMLVQVLEINPSHIPSILLAGEINKDSGKQDVYISYLNAAKAIMEKYGQTDTDTYKEVIKDLQEADESEE
jgi:tetratricopeptide (TPR) repeat protein